MQKIYLYVIHPHSAEGPYDITFPDLPGCVSQADTVAEVLENAEEALRLHMEGLREEGLPIPEPTDFKTYIAANGPKPLGFAVDLPVAAREPVRISISLKPSVLAGIDSAAEEMGLTRSGLIAVAARHYINDMRG